MFVILNKHDPKKYTSKPCKNEKVTSRCSQNYTSSVHLMDEKLSNRKELRMAKIKFVGTISLGIDIVSRCCENLIMSLLLFI